MINQPITDFSTLPPIMAVDFDGTLVKDKFPQIGEEREDICNCIRRLQKLGVRSILWTSRTGKYLDEAVDWCKEHNLNFDTINENLPEVVELAGEDTRKVYADVYLDDRNRSVDSEELNLATRRFLDWLGKKV